MVRLKHPFVPPVSRQLSRTNNAKHMTERGQRVRRIIETVLVVAVLVMTYGTLDALDLAPGVVTADGTLGGVHGIHILPPEPTTPSGEPLGVQRAPAPTVGDAAAPLPAMSAAALQPSADGLAGVLSPIIAKGRLGSAYGLSIRDGFTGKELYAVNGAIPREPASTMKFLTASVVATALDPTEPMVTKVVKGAREGHVVLVAGGDTMLSRGHGDPVAVPGRAGLQDLADEVAAAVSPRTAVTVNLDVSHAPGPRYGPEWDMDNVRIGFTQAVTMIGLADERPKQNHPSPPSPETSVLRAFVTALAARGVTAQPVLDPAQWLTEPATGEVLGSVESAPLGDVLEFALDVSDNALTENLARQAAVANGQPGTFEGVTAFLRARLGRLGIDVGKGVIKDASGLTHGAGISPTVLSRAMTLATTGTAEQFAPIVARLPVAGLDGTLEKRFGDRATGVVAGIPRAKTGSLNNTTSLLGTTVDRDGRLLVYSLVATGLPIGGTSGARMTLDQIVTALTECGCR